MMRYIAILAAAFALLGCGEPRRNPMPADSARMRYLLFPLTPETADRAIIIGGDELVRDTIEYHPSPEPARQIAKTMLSLRPPPPEQLAVCVDNLNRQIKRWGDDTDFERVAFSVTGNTAKLHVFYKNRKFSVYSYEIEDDFTVGNCSVYDSL